MIMETVALRVHKEDREAEDKAKRKEWKKDTSNLEQFR